ncbi:Arsb, partial [Symbiodinium microadriaticum]
MPQYLKKGGYATALVGKWHLGHETLAHAPNQRGYDYFFGMLGGAVDHYTKAIGVGCGSEENGYQDIFADNCRFYNGYDLQENGVPYIDQEHYDTDILASKAVETVLAHNVSRPLFLDFHPTVPHTPVLARKQYLDMCGSGVSPAPKAYQSHFRPKICAMVLSLDVAVFNIILALFAQNMLSSTLFVFHSDNGGLEQAGSSNAPYREGKGSLYEGGIHVPAFMYGHGVQSSYSRISHRADLVHVSDMLPTLLGYAGIDIPRAVAHFDGFNHWDNLVLGRPLKRKHVPINAASVAVGLYSGYI